MLRIVCQGQLNETDIDSLGKLKIKNMSYKSDQQKYLLEETADILDPENKFDASFPSNQFFI